MNSTITEETDECFEPVEQIFPITLAWIVGLSVIVLTVLFLLKSKPFGNEKNSKVLNKDTTQIKLMACFTLVTYAFGNFFYCTSFLLDSINNCDNGVGLDIGAIFIFQVSTISLVKLFAMRLIKTFENNQYAIGGGCVKIIDFGLPTIFFLYVIIIIINASNNELLPRQITIVLLFFLQLFIVGYIIALLRLFLSKLGLIIDDFVKQFGRVSPPQLAKLNKSLSRYFMCELVN